MAESNGLDAGKSARGSLHKVSLLGNSDPRSGQAGVELLPAAPG
jgi:hypothetical protein